MYDVNQCVNLLEHDELFLSDQLFFRLTYRLCLSHQGLLSIDEQSYLPAAPFFFLSASCFSSVSSFWSRSSSAFSSRGNNASRAYAFTSKGQFLLSNRPLNVTKSVLHSLHITSVVSDNSHFPLPFLVCKRTLKHAETLSLTLFSFLHWKYWHCRLGKCIT